MATKRVRTKGVKEPKTQTLQSLGNSTGLIVRSEVLAELGWDKREPIKAEVVGPKKNRRLVISKA